MEQLLEGFWNRVRAWGPELGLIMYRSEWVLGCLSDKSCISNTSRFLACLYRGHFDMLTFDLPWQTWGREFKGPRIPLTAAVSVRETGSLTRTKWNFRRSLIIPSSLNVVTTIGMGKGLSRLRCYRYFCQNLSHSLPAESSRCQRWARSGRSGPYVRRDSGVEPPPQNVCSGEMELGLTRRPLHAR